LTRTVKPYQTEGVYHGKRDIHRRPFEVWPIPEFDKKNGVHAEIAKLARAARTKMEKWGPDMQGGLAKVREVSRDLLSDELRRIDELVSEMFGGKGTPEQKPKKRSSQSDLFG
jgi:hypothetical protein